MKLHKGLVEAVVSALHDIFLKNRQADRVVEAVLKSNKKWGARDRAFIAENTYEMVRWWRLISYCANIKGLPNSVEFWQLFGTWQIIKPLRLNLEAESQLPEWVEFTEVNREFVLEKYQEALAARKIIQSIPDWIDEIGERELGGSWDGTITALNQQAPLVLRVNTLKSNLATVRESIGFENTEVVAGVSNALIVKKRINIGNQEGFKEGFYEVQDGGSQLIAQYLDVKPGLSVIDACAGAGGKTLHIAALLENRGSILAMDVEEQKLEELKRRATRNGVKNLETMVIAPEGIDANLESVADRLLLDVPCSGLGVLRRNPDSKWKLKPQFLETIRKVQWDILSTYSLMVKPGGKMVYATCSVLPSESEDQVKRFLKKFGKEWKFISEHRTNIDKDGFDGFYMALMQRK